MNRSNAIINTADGLYFNTNFLLSKGKSSVSAAVTKLFNTIRVNETY